MPHDPADTATLERPPDAVAPAPVARRKAAFGISALAILALAASALNYISSLVFSRVLDPVGFGELTSLLALAAIIAVPTTAAQTVIAERVAVHQAQGRMDAVRYLVRHGIAHILVLATVGTAIYVLCIPLVVELFSL